MFSAWDGAVHLTAEPAFTEDAAATAQKARDVGGKVTVAINAQISSGTNIDDKSVPMGEHFVVAFASSCHSQNKLLRIN